MDDELGASTASSLNSSGMPTPSSGTRPVSQTNSYIQSCASTLSGVDDRKLDEILGDGIHNQAIAENMVTKELQTQDQLEKQKARESGPVCDADQIFEALLNVGSSSSEESEKIMGLFEDNSYREEEIFLVGTNANYKKFLSTNLLSLSLILTLLLNLFQLSQT